MATSLNYLYEFGPFQLAPLERLLVCEGQPVPIPPKAFELLVALVERAGHLVEKEELLKVVWRGQFVEEGNLSVTVSMLRKALNDDRDSHKYIETVSKRGYRFVADVKVAEEPEGAPSSVAPLEPPMSSEESTSFPFRAPAVAGTRSETLLVWCALAVTLGLGAFWGVARAFPHHGNTASPDGVVTSVRTIAVLPFQSLGVNQADKYLGLGMADALITRLANPGKIIVRPTSAIQQYVDKQMTPRAAGQEQGVDAVLDGRIQREADRVRLTVQLIRVRDGVQLWGETFDRKYTDIFALEDSLSDRLAQAIQLKLTGEQPRRLTKRAAVRPEAYESYVKGRYFWNKRTDKGVKKGLDYFREAITLDPAFAEAYAGIADSYATLGLYAMLPPRDAFPAAKAAAQRALEIDDGLAEAHATLGFINFYYDWNSAAAVNEFQRALTENPNYAMAHSWYGESLAAMGRYDEATDEALRALADDPLSLVIGSNAGWTLTLAGKSDQAIEILKKSIEIDPAFPRTHYRLGRVYEQKKLYALAISELQQAVSLSGGDSCYKGSLGHAYAVAGDTVEARKVLQELEARQDRLYVPAYAIALVYAGMGESDHAIQWLQKAFEDRSTSVAFMKLDGELAGLHSDPRFDLLASRIHF